MSYELKKDVAEIMSMIVAIYISSFLSPQGKDSGYLLNRPAKMLHARITPLHVEVKNDEDDALSVLQRDACSMQ